MIKKLENDSLEITEVETSLNDKNLEFQKRLFKSAVNQFRESVIITDLKNNIIFVNKAFSITYGYTFQEVLNKPVEILRPDYINQIISKKILEETRSEKWEGKILNKKKDGSEFYIFLKSSPIKDETGNTIAYLGFIEDVTKQLKIEDELKTYEDKYQKLFWELKDVVYESTPNGKFLELNPAGMKLFGFNENDDIKNLNITEDLYCNANDREKFKKELEIHGSINNFEIEIINKLGEKLNVIESAYAIKNEDGKIISYRGILRDITDSKFQEEKLKLYIREIAEGNKKLYESEVELKKINTAKDKLFSIIAHDLRSPFTSLIGLSDFLVEDINEFSRDEIKNFVVKINNSARGVFKLLENLLQWSRIQTGGMEISPIKFDLHSIISETINLLGHNAAHKNINLINKVKIRTYVLADNYMISSVIQNLVTNAIKFTKADGKVIISSKEDDNYVYISIIDNGIGIRKKDINKLFRIEAYHTTLGTANEKGSGLGLVLCKELVEQNNGNIEVNSKEGEGTTFTFSLPKAK